jgi:ubiquinone/menaquinone biosynthesis C-methylase UbiE
MTAFEKEAYRARYKYDLDNEANDYYKRRDLKKHLAELQLIDRAFADIPKHHRVLDLPCGGGRLCVHLGQQGYQMSGADLSESMRNLAQKNIAEAGISCNIESQDIERLTYDAQFFDTIVCFRLFHHFPTKEIRKTAVTELCRVAKDTVVLSYFSPYSWTSLRRFVKRMAGKNIPRYATSLSELESYFNACGFQLKQDFAQLPFMHTLHVAVFERMP